MRERSKQRWELENGRERKAINGAGEGKKGQKQSRVSNMFRLEMRLEDSTVATKSAKREG